MAQNKIIDLAKRVLGFGEIITLANVKDQYGESIAAMVYSETIIQSWRDRSKQWTRRVR